MDYIRTTIDDMITIHAIITVYDTDLRNSTAEGESHNFPEIIYVREGYSDFLVDGADIHLDKGQLIVLPPNAFHGPPANYTKGTGIHSIFSFVSDSPLLQGLYDRILTLTDDQITQYLAILQKGLSLFEKASLGNNKRGMIKRNGASEYGILSLKKQLELFLLDLYYTHIHTEDIGRLHKKSQQLAQLNSYLQTHIKEKLSLEQMGQDVGMSSSTLRRLIGELCGCGPVNYFINMKIDKAKLLIKENQLSYTEIAESLGFETIHYFSRQFKKRVGLSPREYSKQYVKKPDSSQSVTFLNNTLNGDFYEIHSK